MVFPGKHTIGFFTFFLAILAFLPAFADPLQLVITPTRSETPLEQIGSSITVITEEDIQARQQQGVIDLLRDVPGLDVTQAGGAGQTASVFIRGAPSEHTLVLIDGVEVNDPTSTTGSYDFENLHTDNIERIEVLRGNQSTLYGSNAIGGVINIITKHGAGDPYGWASAEAGSYQTYKAAGGISGKVDNVGFNFSATRFSTAGFSSFDHRLGGQGGDSNNYEDFADRVEVKINPVFSAYTTLRYDDSRTQFDDFGANANDDTHAKELSMRNAIKAILLDGQWDQEVGLSYYQLNRDTTLNGMYGGYYLYQGDRTVLDWLNHLKVNSSNLLTFGAETKYENARTSDADMTDFNRINGYFLQDQIGFTQQFYTTVGGRIDDNRLFGSKDTYRVAPVYTLEQTDTRLKASYGTGFKAPSLYQLFSVYGNPGLKPEDSKGYDFGFEQPFFSNRLQIGSTFFHNTIRNLIDYDDATNKYLNVSAANMNGVENSIKWCPVPDWMIRLQYTYTDAYDAGTGQELLRRARNKGALDMDYSFWEQGKAGLNMLYKGKRQDMDFDYDTVTMPSYILVNLTGSWQLSDNIGLLGRIDNLLDRRYEDVYGYGTAGLSLYAGVTVKY